MKSSMLGAAGGVAFAALAIICCAAPLLVLGGITALGGVALAAFHAQAVVIGAAIVLAIALAVILLVKVRRDSRRPL